MCGQGIIIFKREREMRYGTGSVLTTLGVGANKSPPSLPANFGAAPANNGPVESGSNPGRIPETLSPPPAFLGVKG